MKKLKQELERLIATRPNAAAFRMSLEKLESAYPFNEYEYIISKLLVAGKLSCNDYVELRDSYFARHPLLFVFEMGPTRFAGWAVDRLKEFVSDLQKQTKECDPSYDEEYDLILDGKIKIEVKASRAVDFDSDEPLCVKALASDSKERFDMNFQQLKPDCCDVCVGVGVWRDVIRYWVLASKEVASNSHYSRWQHRKRKDEGQLHLKKNSIAEGQLHLKKNNIAEFAVYEAKSNELAAKIRGAYERQVAR